MLPVRHCGGVLAQSNAKLRVEQTEEAFTFSVLSPDRPAVVRRMELTCPPWWREMLRKEAEARAAALRAAGDAAQGSPPPAAGMRGSERAYEGAPRVRAATGE